VKNLSEILELPVDQRLQLVEAIWDSLAELPEAVPITDDVRDELDRRLAAYYEDPSSARPWREIKQELFGEK
jgi:putative addiction module component (TIGR02574 family)